jgi:hypothetical protein
MAKPIADKFTRRASPITAREFFLRSVDDYKDHESCSVTHKETTRHVIRLFCTCNTMLSVPKSDMTQTILQNVPEGRLGKLALKGGGG